MKTKQISAWQASLGVVVLMIAGCDGGASAVPVRTVTHDPSEDRQSFSSADRSRPGESEGTSKQSSDAFGEGSPRDAPVPRLEGRPLWSANSQRTAEENAERQFERNGEDFNAASVTEYAKMAHAFIRKPPRGAETIERSNGDRLIYDPTGNVFVVATSEGAPRTMFRPRDGARYWEEQKEKNSDSGPA